ncbi:hypothetical protein GCM10023149_44850 [Mucilaginibacter gynuensis]|uniref:histidine kinase n=1 Tax=Mucilaginibacter gynuensis TaxID=1302236 RepID=A0ABP8HA38_9SPHI
MSSPNADKPYNLDLFFELSADLLCIAGYDGYFKKINPAVSKLLGYTPEELLARPIHEFIFTGDKDVTARNRESLLNDTPLLNFENRYVTKSGEIVWLSWTSMPVADQQVVFAIAKNITHKKKLEEERDQLIDDLAQTNNDLKHLAYMTSHDLRTPVSNLLLGFDLMDLSKIKDDDTLMFIDVLKSAAESLKTTLNNYVDVLIQKSTQNIITEELNVNDSLAIVLRSLNSLLFSSRVTINTDFSAAETVVFNRAYLESVFLNLISNAIKYARPEVGPQINIYTERENGKTKLIVADNGLGFDMIKVKDRLFGFNQKFGNNADSKGIGLYLVYHHITSLGGEITVESKLNAGARFIITFK